jgi:integrase
MEKQRPPYLIKRKGWKGQTVWYYWKRPKPQIRLIGEYGTREFWESYERASLGSLAIVRKRQVSDKPKASLAWLIERYRETGDWSDKSAATRRQRENIFRRITDANPDLAYEDVDRALIVQTRDAKKDTPSEANNFLDALRGLFKWAVDAGFVENNPVAGIKNLKRPKTGGFRMWTEEDIALFRNKWPIGTRERLALEIFVNTGLRRGDASRLGRQHLRNGHVRIVTEKTKTEIEYPVPNEFLQVVDKSPTGDMTLLVSKVTGMPLSKEGLGTWFHKSAKAAGVDGNCHGLRKAAASRLAEAGATIPELNAVFGWSGTSMASLYTEKASRKILAANAAAKLGG